MTIMHYELIINPKKKEHNPNRYKAVLLLNGGISKAYPHEMGMEMIVKSAAAEVDSFAEGKLKLTYHK